MSCRRRRGPTRPQSGAAARKRRGQKAPRPTAAVKQGRGQTRPWSNKAAAAANRPSCLPAVAQHRPVKNRPTAAANRRGQTTHAAAKQGRGQKTLNRRRDPISPGQEPPKRAVKQNPRPSTAAAKHRRAQASPKRGGQAKRRGPVQRRGPTGQTARPNWSNSAAQLVKQRGPTKRGGHTNAVVGSNWSNSAAANRPVKRPRTAPASTTPAARTAGRPGRPRCNQNAVVKQPRMWSNTTLTPVINRRPPAAGY